MALPRDEQGPQRLRSVPLFDNLNLENSFEDNGVSGNMCLICWRWRMTSFSGVSQRSQHRGKCAHLLRGLAAATDLPPHNTLFSQQLLDLTHRWWSEAEGPDIDVGDVHPLVAAAYICIRLHSARYPDPALFQLQDPRQPARSLTDLLTTLAAVLGRCEPHDVPAGRLGASLRDPLLPEGPASSAAPPAGDWLTLLSLLSRVPSGGLASVALCIANDFVLDHPFSLESTPSRIGRYDWFFSCVVWVCFLLSGDR